MRSFLFLILLIAGMSTFSACKNSQARTEPAHEVIAVTTQPITSVNYTPRLEYSGMIASDREAKLSFKIGGIIAHTYVKEGDPVHAGQLLAVLDMTEIGAQVLQSVQGTEKASRDLERVQHLFQDTAATLEQLQNANTQYKMASENLQIARFNQQYAQIRALENGTVIKKLMNEGELASPGAPVYVINGSASADWVVRFGVGDREWALLKKGNSADVNIEAYPDRTFQGVITKVADAADGLSGTYEVEVKVLPGSCHFAAGLFATIHPHPFSSQPVRVIPVEALSEADGKTGYVYLLNPDKQTVRKQAVNIAFITDGRVGIAGGLENQSEVITGGLNYLTPDARVHWIRP